MRKIKTFTLIEILTVIGILIMLAGILFPAFISARKKAYQTDCMSNLSQIGKSLSMYASDYDDKIPFGASPWDKMALLNGKPLFDEPYRTYALKQPDIRILLLSYGVVNHLWICKSDRLSQLFSSEGGHKSTFYEECGSSYGYDSMSALMEQTLSEYEKPTESVLFWDMYSAAHGGEELNENLSRVNVVFADIHVQSVTEKQLRNYLHGDR